MTLTEFLLARIAEDEAAARGSLADVANRRTLGIPPEWLTGVAERVLAECEAKRRIVGLRDGWLDARGFSPDYWSAPVDHIVALLALPYAGHPEYDPQWLADHQPLPRSDPR